MHMWASKLFMLTCMLKPLTIIEHNCLYGSTKLPGYGIHRRGWVMRFNQVTTSNMQKVLGKYKNVRRQQDMWYNWEALVQWHAATLARCSLQLVMIHNPERGLFQGLGLLILVQIGNWFQVWILFSSSSFPKKTCALVQVLLHSSQQCSSCYSYS